MAANPQERRIAARRVAAGDGSVERVEPRLDVDASARDPNYYEDLEGHRRLMYSLGADFDLADPVFGTARQSAAGRWRLSSTFFLVVGFNVAAWSAIVGAVYALV